jgi:enoyl-CoA hydratase
MSDVLLVEKLEGRIALLTVNRPDKMNALNGEVREALFDAFPLLASDDDVRVVVITGAGEKAFIAGADIAEFKDARAVEQYRSMQAGNIYSLMENFPKPIIAMINGYCLGGGCELAMACDMRIASTRAKLGQPEINLGLIPGGGGTQRLPRLVGEGHANHLIMSGALIGGEEAARIGLVEQVLPPEELREATLALAATIGSRSPIALQAAKETVLAARRMPLDEGLKFERAWFGLLFATDDKDEGVGAFLEKREPVFRGS